MDSLQDGVRESCRCSEDGVAWGETDMRHTWTLVGCLWPRVWQDKWLSVARDGFSLSAAGACEAHQCEKPECVRRYVATGPAHSRAARETVAGKLVDMVTDSFSRNIPELIAVGYVLRKAFADKTT
jgi:hypothetical protein